jgi:hypothetical protein
MRIDIFNVFGFSFVGLPIFFTGNTSFLYHDSIIH